MTLLEFLNKKTVTGAVTLPDPLTMKHCKIGANGYVVEVDYRDPRDIAAAIFWTEKAKQGIGQCNECGRANDDHSAYCEYIRGKRREANGEIK